MVGDGVTVNTIPVTFPNKDGHKLFGILHKPSNGTQKDAGIIILSPGVKSRVAPHRMYVKMAKRFCDMGFHVLRFDFYGLGDSEGEVHEEYNADFYGSVQVGRYIADTLSAMDWMEKECNIRRIVLAGLCGGAITGLLAGCNDKRVHSLLGLGVPVILDSANIDQSRYITRGQLNDLRRAYLDKLLDIKSWVRFLSFKSDFRLMFKSLFHSFIQKPADAVKQSGAVQQDGGSPRKQESNFNGYFPTALHQMLSSNKVAFIFSGSDRLYWEFEEKYMIPYKQEFEKYKKNIEISVIKDANHIFSFQEWQDDMLAKACSWLEETC